MTLTDTVSTNLQTIMQTHDLSTRGLSARTNPTIPQKTIWTVLKGTNSAKLSTIEAICKTLFVSPAAMVTPNLPPDLLMSRRLPRLIEAYAGMSRDDRDRLEGYIGTLGDNKESADSVDS